MIKLAILIMIILLIVAAKITKQDFFSPAVINIYWNAFFVICAVILFGNGIEWEYEGIFWIILSCFCFLIGQIYGQKIKICENHYRERKVGNYINVILFVLVIISLINPYIYIKEFGYSVWDIFDLNKLLKINADIAYDRYIGHQFQGSAIQTLISIIMYFSAIVGGYCFNYQKKNKEKILCVIVIMPTMLLTIITNAKLAVIASVFLWGTGWILSFINLNGDNIALNKKMIMLGIAILIVGIGFFDIAMLMRYGGINAETQKIANLKLQEYIFGQIQAFTIWFKNTDRRSYTLGGSTYMFIPNWLGISTKIQGVYEPLTDTGTNIFTQNRGIIEDFGVVGGLIYWIVLGFFAGITYKKIKKRAQNTGVILILGGIYFSILHGFMISPWVYSSYVLAFVGFGVFLVVLKYVNINFKR